MFVQIHILQSMPPGNLNRDDEGQPKKCIFGGVTRGRISSQCLKRNIRHSIQFKEVFGDDLATRTTYLPRMVADELRKSDPSITDDELNKVKAALASKFKAEKRGGNSDEAAEGEEAQAQPESSSAVSDGADRTGQLVFFPPPFAKEIAELVVELRGRTPPAYNRFIGTKAKLSKAEEKALDKTVDEFVQRASAASKKLTVDIGLFGRMTTSDLVVNVEAACQVAHAISTHETLIESDYFTAMDEKKQEFASTQTEKTGAAFLGSGDTETFFNSAVYYKYLNLDIDALKKHLSWQSDKAALAAGVLVRAAALSNPTGKQNSFAAHGVPELILVEVSEAKCPISYANAFLEPVDGINLMRESAAAMSNYIDTVVAAFSPTDMSRALLAVGSASVDIAKAKRVNTLEDLIKSVVKLVEGTA